MRIVGKRGFGAASTQVASPQAQMLNPRAGNPGDTAVDARLTTLEQSVTALAQQNNALVQENQQLKGHLGTLARQNQQFAQHFNGLVRAINVGYSPEPATNVPGQQTSAGIPTHTYRGSNTRATLVNGTAGAPVAQNLSPRAGAPGTAAGNPGTAAQRLASAADSVFYGDGDSAFYEGEGD